MHNFAAERWRVQVLVYRLLTGHAKTGHSLFYFSPIAKEILWLARFSLRQFFAILCPSRAA